MSNPRFDPVNIGDFAHSKKTKKSFDVATGWVQTLSREQKLASKASLFLPSIPAFRRLRLRRLLVLCRLAILNPSHPMNYPKSIPVAYKSADLERAYRLGWNHGHGIACHNVPEIGDSIDRSVDWVGLGKTVTSENIAEYHEALCFAAESNSREFSPFEFIAHEFNESDDSESLWEAFESGVCNSIREDLKGYSYAETV